MADAAMLSPMPRKAFMASTPCTPNKLEDPSIARPFWYDDDEATCELRGVLSAKAVLPDWVPAMHSRAMSAASTSAGPTPSLDDFSPTYASSPPLSPECTDTAQECPRYSQSQPSCPVVSEKSSWIQERKVFVGGVPQHIDQATLYKMFSRMAKVKKAWLQLMHADNRMRQPSADKKHRGFGFVIFSDTIAVEQLLGDSFSRIICFDENVKMEVKRAVCKNSPHLVASARQPSDESCKFISELQAGASPLTQREWQPPLTNFDDLPYVPPFPSETEILSETVQRPGHENLSAPMMQRLPSQHVTPNVQTNFPCLPETDLPFLPDVLLHGFAGVRPSSAEELKLMLEQAMPECYDD